MIKTKLTDIFGLDVPIVEGGMLWLGRAELAAAVSEAGGLGMISANTFESAEDLRAEIERMKKLTDKKIGVNISMLPGEGSEEDIILEYVEVVTNQGVNVVETAGKPPGFVEELHEAGIKLIHKVPASPRKNIARYAESAEDFGADAVAVVGYEGAGHPGLTETPSKVFLSHAVDSVDIPVIGAGGFCTGRHLASAIMLGAEGILMGTRFALTEESPAHPDIKQYLLNVDSRDTMIIQRSIDNPIRCLINEASERALGMETRDASLEELLTVISGQKGKKAWLEGKVDAGIVSLGQCVGQIDRIKSVEEVIQEIIEEAEDLLE